MRRNAKLTFTRREDRPPLSAGDVRYWQDLLRKICKVGFEHEYNLEENRGTCNGQSFACPCSHPLREVRKCYTKCTKWDNCKLRLKYPCPGIYCVEFSSPCPTCTEAVRDCSACPMFNNPNKKPALARQKIQEALKPTKDLTVAGTYEVVKDGSLEGDGGVEVTTVGRRVSYESFYRQAQKIIAECEKNGAYINERASIHMHLIAGYFNLTSNRNGGISAVYNKGRRGENGTLNLQELEQPLPEIVLANFHQLVRRYHNAITWITSAGNSAEHLTRWVKFRQPILKYSALRSPMTKVCQQISQNVDSSGKYAFVNYYHTTFDRRFRVSRLHLEARYCDGLMSPSAVASLGILLYSLMMKAVHLSQYGIMHSGTSEYMEQAYEIQKVLLNNNGSYQGPRTSDTRTFAPYMEIVREQANEMVTMLHSELKKHGDAVKVLKALADMPCSMRLVRGDDWSTIETDLSGNGEEVSEDVLNYIMQAVDTGYVDDCVDSNEWVAAISEDSDVASETLKSAADILFRSHKISWDAVSGTFVRC